MIAGGCGTEEGARKASRWEWEPAISIYFWYRGALSAFAWTGRQTPTAFCSVSLSTPRTLFVMQSNVFVCRGMTDWFHIFCTCTIV